MGALPLELKGQPEQPAGPVCRWHQGSWEDPPPLLGIGGAVNPEVRLHLHPLLSLLGKLQTQRPLFLQREGSLGLGQCAAGWGG